MNAADAGEEPRLWEAMRSGADPGARARLIDMHLPFARIMAAKLYAARITNELEFEEYLQYASTGLLECIDRYDPSYGASFRTYASHRMTGAILNGVQISSEKQEQIAFRARIGAERTQSLRGDKPAADAGPDALFANLARIAVGLALGYVLEDSGMFREDEGGTMDNSYQRIELRQLQKRVRALVDNLPERERLIIRYHYFNHVPFDHIAGMLGVTKGRISQLHKRALEWLHEEARNVSKCDIAW